MNLKDMFGRDITPGDSFLRIEDQMGGARLRYYFFGGPVEDDCHKIHVQEYGGSARTIFRPSCPLILLTDDLLQLSKLTPPTVESVVSPAKKKKAASKAPVVI